MNTYICACFVLIYRATFTIYIRAFVAKICAVLSVYGLWQGTASRIFINSLAGRESVHVVRRRVPTSIPRRLSFRRQRCRFPFPVSPHFPCESSIIRPHSASRPWKRNWNPHPTRPEKHRRQQTATNRRYPRVNMLYFRLISKLLINGCHDVYTQTFKSKYGFVFGCCFGCIKQRHLIYSWGRALVTLDEISLLENSF